MKASKETYRCWFLINQHRQNKHFIVDEKAAADTFINFLADKNYGKGIGLFRFDIYIESKVNIGHHTDSVYTGCAHLSAHIDNDTFTSANSKQRHKYLLNAALTLCKFLADKVVLPKDFDIATLIKDYITFLEENSLLLTEKQMSDIIIKPFETTKFNFVITSTAEVKDKDIHYDLMKIQDFLNNHLSGKTFGKSVRQLDFGYEIYDFQGHMKPWEQTANLRRYGTKYKNLLVVKQFDYQQLKNKTHMEQFDILKATILEAINDFDKLNRKPKDFNKEQFAQTIENLLTDYSEKYCH